MYLGRLSPEKGVGVLLDALDGLHELQVKIAGHGPHGEILREMAHRHRKGQVEFLGHVAGEVKWRLLREAMGAVVPSLCYENFAFAVLESMAVATPVVASNLGSLPYIVEGGKSGLLFRPGDSEELREKLLWLTIHPKEALAMGRYGRAVVEQCYSASAHYETLMRVYREAMDW